MRNCKVVGWTLILCSIFLKINAQSIIDYQSTTYLSGFGAWAGGKYQNSLVASGARTSSFGGALGYLKKIGKDVTFPLLVGGEFGIKSVGSGVVNSQIPGDFRTSTNAYWLNAVARYRPVYWDYFINPFVDVAVGPMINSTGIFEQFNAEEFTRIDGKTSTVLNSMIGLGIGLKLPNQEGRIIYFDIGVYYQQTGSTRIIERNSVLINQDNQLFFREQVTPLSNTQLRLGLSWFR